MRNVMHYSGLLGRMSLGRAFRRQEVTVRIGDIPEDTRKAVRVEQLDEEWVRALNEADYSHLPSKLPA